MTFAWPHLLWLILLPAAWLGRELGRRRGAARTTYPHIARADAGTHGLALRPAGPELDAAGRPSLGGSSARVRVWLCLGLALGLAALARPQWGRLDEPVFEQSREIMIAVDLSRSMLTPDVKPSRLERAKLLIQSLLDGLEGERVGLISFAGTAFVQAPLSADYEILREFLPSLGPDFMPVGGTDYGALIDTAAGAFSSGGGADRYLIVLSDGGATDDEWRQHLPKLKAKGIRVIGLGLGTDQGALIPDGAGGYVKDERGAVVMSKLDSGTLRELSTATDGTYRDASTWIDLPRLLRTTVEAGRKGRFTEKNTVRYAERFQWALAPALLCLALSFLREFPVRPKARQIALQGETAAKSAGLPAAALLILAGLAAAPAARAAAAEPPMAPGALLGRIVGRLSNQASTGALDWLELGKETLTWGQQIQSSGQPVPPGPIHDGIDAVDRGRDLDPKAADWPKLRSDLEALLKQPDKPKSQQQHQQQQNQQQQKNQQQQQKQQSSSNSSSQQQSQQQQQQQQDQSQSSSGQNGQPQNKPASESAFGNMQPPNQNQNPAGQPESGDSGSRKVGGARASRPDPANADPTLSPLMQKLEEVKDRDSPAELYQMFERNEPHPPEKKGKDW